MDIFQLKPNPEIEAFIESLKTWRAESEKSTIILGGPNCICRKGEGGRG